LYGAFIKKKTSLADGKKWNLLLGDSRVKFKIAALTISS
jgi:hypothetical protein